MLGRRVVDGRLPQVDSTGIPSLNSRDAETGGAASESGCSISTLLLYQGESQNLVAHTDVVQHNIMIYGHGTIASQGQITYYGL